MARLTTYLDLKSCEILRSSFNFKSNLTSAIDNLANCSFLASYVSRHKAMAYDIELKVKLPMMLEIDDKGAVDLIKSFAVGGRTCHINIKQCVLWDLKESKQLIVN